MRVVNNVYKINTPVVNERSMENINVIEFQCCSADAAVSLKWGECVAVRNPAILATIWRC